MMIASVGTILGDDLPVNISEAKPIDQHSKPTKNYSAIVLALHLHWGTMETKDRFTIHYNFGYTRKCEWVSLINTRQKPSMANTEMKNPSLVNTEMKKGAPKLCF